ncbi:hypothetical protein ACFLUJ_01525 [Chloroflexota bacterium]
MDEYTLVVADFCTLCLLCLIGKPARIDCATRRVDLSRSARLLFGQRNGLTAD